MSQGYSVFYTKRDLPKIVKTSYNTTTDFHVLNGESDVFQMQSGQYFEINFKTKSLKCLDNCVETKIVSNVREKGVRKIEISEPISVLTKELQLEDILNKYRHLIGKTWTEEKGSQEYFDFRKLVVDSLLNHVIDELECTSVCTFRAVGSVTLYSDYDVTVEGPQATKVVRQFNNQFREIFGMESATAFDTNIYGASFVQVIKPDNFGEYTHGDKKIQYVKNDTTVSKMRQRHWALVKVNLYLTDEERRSLHAILDPITEQVSYLEFVVPDRSDIKSMNDEYGEALKVVSKYKNMMKSPLITNKKELESLKEHYLDAISLSNYFGNEMYFTQGAYLHVVENLQAGTNIPLSKDDYMDSFIENIGDCLKELTHESEVCNKLIEGLSKYYSRASDALVKMGYEEASESQRSSEDVRIRVRNRKKSIECATEDTSCVLPEKASELTKAFIESLGVDSCEEFRSFFIALLLRYI